MTTVVFDANGTLFNLAPVTDAIGGKVRRDAFFERLLHSAAAVTLAGEWAPFDELAASTLATTCATLDLDDVEQSRVLAAMNELPDITFLLRGFARLRPNTVEVHLEARLAERHRHARSRRKLHTQTETRVGQLDDGLHLRIVSAPRIAMVDQDIERPRFRGLRSSGGGLWTHFPDRFAYRFTEVRGLETT